MTIECKNCSMHEQCICEETHLEFCTDCKRAYSSEEDRGFH